MYDVPKDLLDGYGAGPDIFRALLKGCTQEQAQNALGGDENWSVVEVMCHMRDAEERALERSTKMRDENNPFLPAYDQDAWAEERHYAEANLQEALSAFLGYRAQHLALLEGLAPQDWERKGRHEEQGEITISGQTMHLVAHDLQHAAQIARQLGKA